MLCDRAVWAWTSFTINYDDDNNPFLTGDCMILYTVLYHSDKAVPGAW